MRLVEGCFNEFNEFFTVLKKIGRLKILQSKKYIR